MKAGLFIVAVSILPMGMAAAECNFPAAVCQAQAVFEVAEDDLEQTVKAVRTNIANDIYVDYLVEADVLSESFENAQIAWSGYRDANCTAVVRLMSGGTSHQEDELSCHAELAKARTAELRELYEISDLLESDGDLAWLDGHWYTGCNRNSPVLSFEVRGDGIYAVSDPEIDVRDDPDLFKKAGIEQRSDGYVNITPAGWDNRFLRVTQAGDNRMIGDLYERLGGTPAPMEGIALFKCPGE